MALVVVTEPFDPACNSYVSEAEMAAYVTERVPDPAVLAAWDALSPELQATYVVNASRFIDNMMEWIGDRYSRDQRLDWPRVNAVIDGFLLDQITFPTAVKEATCEMVVFSMQNNGVVAVQTNAAFDSIRVGPINIDFNEAASEPLKKFYPEIVEYILRDYGQIINLSSKGIRVVNLRRA